MKLSQVAARCNERIRDHSNEGIDGALIIEEEFKRWLDEHFIDPLVELKLGFEARQLLCARDIQRVIDHERYVIGG